MTPYEAYCGDSDKYDLILSSVKRFTGGLADEKLRRFSLADISEFEDFSSRHLNDTRFASKSVMKFLGTLYGGVYDTRGKRRVQALAGGITALIRSGLGLNDILGNGIKNRNDHRHHAIDAITIAVTSPKIVQKLANILKDMEKKQSDRFKLEIKNSLTFNNWPDFRQDAFKAVNDIIISHYVSRKARGPFHEETIYSKSHKEKDKNNKYAEFKYVRKQLTDLALNNVDEIVDHAVRKAVFNKLEELGEKNLKKAFSKPENLPVLKNGHIVKRVKIRKKQETRTVGQKDRARNVVLGKNHHMEIVAVLDDKGNETKWEGYVVSLFDTRQRIKNKKPIVNKDFGAGKIFKFSLARGDIIKLTEDDGSEVFRIIRDVPQSKQLSFVALNDARKKKDIKEAKEWYTGMPNSLMKKSCRKYSITPLGTLRRAND
jgi:CRISPR-associated endonuclease Csn1